MAYKIKKEKRIPFEKDIYGTWYDENGNEIMKREYRRKRRKNEPIIIMD